MSISWWMDKKKYSIYLCNELSFGNKKEQSRFLEQWKFSIKLKKNFKVWLIYNVPSISAIQRSVHFLHFFSYYLPSCCCKWHYFVVLFYGWAVFYCDWISGLFPCLCHCESCCKELRVYVSFWMKVLSGYMPRSGIAGSHGSSIIVFWGTSILFSIVVVPIYIPTNSEKVFPFLHTLSSICCL